MVRANYSCDGRRDFTDEFFARIEAVWGGAEFGASSNRIGIFAHRD